VSESEPISKHRVITVHGVNSNGAWQEEVKAALGVFFDFEPIKYNHYRFCFGTEVGFNPFVWLPLGILLAIAVFRGWVRGGWEIAGRVVLLILLTHLAAYPYRSWAEKAFRKRLSKKFEESGAPPSLIAHSFGTYLSGRALRDLPWPRFNRMVLAGCVLDAEFPWSAIRGSDPFRFSEVRNEMAARDRVARFAASLERLIPGFGSAGYAGFKGTSDWIHQVESANAVCVLCENTGSRAPIHNVKCEKLGHSDVFLGPAYAVLYWIPFLWGYDPAAYQNFLSICYEIGQATQDKRKQDMKDNYQKLRNSSWGQTPKKTLDREIVAAVPKGHVPSEDDLDKIATETLRFVLLGQHALDDETTVGRSKFIQCLNIFVAIDLGWRKLQWQCGTGRGRITRQGCICWCDT
jgi:hypothetical protein